MNGRVHRGRGAEALQALGRLLSQEEAQLRAALRAKRLGEAKKVKEGEALLERHLMGGGAGPVAAAFDAALTPSLEVYYNRIYYTILYYTILYYTILYYTILYYTILYYTILYMYVYTYIHIYIYIYI